MQRKLITTSYQLFIFPNSSIILLSGESGTMQVKTVISEDITEIELARLTSGTYV